VTVSSTAYGARISSSSSSTTTAASATMKSPLALIATYLNTRYTPVYAQDPLLNPPLLQTDSLQQMPSLAPEIKALLDAAAAAGYTLSSRTAALSLQPSMTPRDTLVNLPGLPSVWEAPVHVLRANSRGRLPLAGPPEPILQVSTTFFPSPTADVPVRIYRPTASPAAPALVWYHGGGWVLNYLDLYDACLTKLANDSGCTIVSVCYQKAPEHPFPVPFDDCFAALLWVRANAQHLQVARASCSLAGCSV
jgi:hypothetical protein